MATAQYAVTGMSCGHCEAAIRDEMSHVAGVTSVEVSAATGTLIVTSDEPIADGAVRSAVDEAGYAAVRVEVSAGHHGADTAQPTAE